MCFHQHPGPKWRPLEKSTYCRVTHLTRGMHKSMTAQFHSKHVTGGNARCERCIHSEVVPWDVWETWLGKWHLIKTGRKNRQWLILVGYEKHRLLEMSSELKNQAMGRKKKMAHRVFRVDPWLLLCLAIKKAVRRSVSLDTDWSWSLHKWMHLLFKHKDHH